MQDELPIRDTWPYEDRPSSWQRTEMRRRTDRADLIASEGSAGAVIARLRARARTARKNSLVFLAGLIATVVFGLAYYLLLPFWENWVDNREATLNATLTEIEDEVRNL